MYTIDERQLASVAKTPIEFDRVMTIYPYSYFMHKGTLYLYTGISGIITINETDGLYCRAVGGYRIVFTPTGRPIIVEGIIESFKETEVYPVSPLFNVLPSW